MANTEIRYSLTPTQEAFAKSEAVVNIIYSNTGEGKSAKKGTPVIMYDGTIKKVEDIVEGDLLMGDDSGPRKVAGLARGQDQMYEIVPVKGDPFTVNGPHILALKRTRMKRKGSNFGEDHQANEIVHITVDDYIKQSPRFKHVHKLYRVPVEFPEKATPIPPYLLGLWLGDGTNLWPEVTTADPEIVDYLKEQAESFGLDLIENTINSSNKAKRYRFKGPQGPKGENPFLEFLKDFALIGNKHIPLTYKANSRQNRLELLAGLIDTDGWFNHEGFQIIQKNQELADDIAFLARSLGLAAYVKSRTKYIKSINFSGTYYHVMISGDCSCIPVRIGRKKCLPRQQIRDVLVTGIKKVIPLGVDTYYGFTIDGNHHFLFGDFTVTHNTFACVAALIEHVARCGQPLRCAIVRDTLENLKSSVVVSISEFFKNNPSAYRFADGYKKLTIFTKPHKITADLFGIDDLSSLGKLQGPEYGLIWLNEPAPIADADRMSAGLSEDVFKAALVRCGRQKGIKARLQVDMNPADQDHWTYRRFLEESEIDPDNPLITKAVFRVPYGENIHASEVSRQLVRAAYKGDEANYARYVEGKFAKVYKGPAVTPTYNEERHLAKAPLVPAPGLISFAFFDSWSNPSCVLGQITQYNRLIFLDTLRLEGSDIETLLETQVIPLLESPRWKGKARAWRVGGDRTMMIMDQSNKLMSAARKVAKYFGAFFDPGPQHWSMIQDHIMWALRQSDHRGEPMVLLSSDNKILHKALNGGWHYHINAQGKRTSTTPVKDEMSHPADAWANAVCVLMPTKLSNIKKHSYKGQADKIRRRAQSYVTGGRM